MRLFFTFAVLTVMAACVNQAVAQPVDDTLGWRKIGDKAPELNVYVLKGDEVVVKEGLGKKVFIVEFWATWCGPCKYSIPHLTKLQEKYKDDGLVVIGISDEPSGLVRPYMEKMGEQMNYTIAIDRAASTKSRYAHGFGAETIPTAFVIDVNGRVSWFGNPMDEFMEKHVELLLTDVPITERGASLEKNEDSSKRETHAKN